MTRTELIEQVADDLDLDPKRVECLYHAFVDAITAALIEGEDVKLRGFGTFRVRDTPASAHSLPTRPDPILTPARRAIRFSTSDLVKARLH